jgi:hypothetical protein
MDTLIAVGLRLVERQPRFDRMGPAYRVTQLWWRVLCEDSKGYAC